MAEQTPVQNEPKHLVLTSALRVPHEVVLELDPTIRRSGVLPWRSQVVQYPEHGEPGIGYFAGVVGGGKPVIDCLLWRDEAGLVRGILNYYSVDFPPYEKAGNVLVLVDPEWRRQGIAHDLVVTAFDRWQIDPTQQKYSSEGRALIAALLQRRGYTLQQSA